MSVKVAPLFLMLFSLQVEARPFMAQLQQKLQGPLKCARMHGTWEGECRAGEESRPAQLQVIQDYCTDITFYDLAYPLPLSFKISSQSDSFAGPYSNLFGNSTKFSEWSKDGKTFHSRNFSTSRFTIQSRETLTQSEDFLTATLNDGKLEIKYSGKTTITDPEGQTIQAGQSICTYTSK